MKRLALNNGAARTMYQGRILPNCWALPLALALGFLMGGTDARATIVAIEYFDQANINPEFAGGPLWTGHVDTLANTLTIESWKELPLHGNEYWIPRSLPAPPLIATEPLVWPARDANGNLYDVPDTFDGHIDDTFAFISDLHLRDMQWKEPLFDYSPLPEDPPIFLGTVDVEYTLNTGDVWPGWGGFALQVNDGGVIVKQYRTANPDVQQPDYDEHIMPALPVRPPGEEFPTYVASTDAIVTAIPMPLEPNPVPEARQWLAIVAVFSAALAFRWLAERRRSVAARRAS